MYYYYYYIIIINIITIIIIIRFYLIYKNSNLYCIATAIHQLRGQLATALDVASAK